MDQTTDTKNATTAPIDAKVDMVAKLAGVNGLKLVSSAAGGTQVFVGSCTADGLRGTSCSLKLIRGDIDHLRRQGDFFRRVSDTQADAGGTLTPSSHGLARVLFHELVALPGDDAVLAVVTVMVPGVSFADVVRTCATGVRALSFAQTLLLVSSCFKALAQAQDAFGGKEQIALLMQQVGRPCALADADQQDAANALAEAGEAPAGVSLQEGYLLVNFTGWTAE